MLRQNLFVGELSSKEQKKTLARLRLFFSRKKARHTKSFCSRMMKNRQHQHKGKQHTQKKFQGTAISVVETFSVIFIRPF